MKSLLKNLHVCNVNIKELHHVFHFKPRTHGAVKTHLYVMTPLKNSPVHGCPIISKGYGGDETCVALTGHDAGAELKVPHLDRVVLSSRDQVELLSSRVEGHIPVKYQKCDLETRVNVRC